MFFGPNGAELETPVDHGHSLGVVGIGDGCVAARGRIEHRQRCAITEVGGKQRRRQAILADAHGKRARQIT